MFITDEGEKITMAEHAAGMLEGRATTIQSEGTKVLSARIALSLAADVQAIAQKSGVSRNLMISKILEAGIDAIREHISEETSLEIAELSQEYFQTFLKELEA